MEMLSVSLMLPFVEAILNPKKIMVYPIVKNICTFLKVYDENVFLIILALFMGVLYILKNAFLLFQIMIQNRFVHGNLFLTQKKLLHSYLTRPYEFFLGAKSGEILRNIGTDTVASFGILTHVLTLFSELIVSGALLIAIIIVSPGTTLAVGVLSGMLVWIIQVMIRPYLKRAGENHQVSFANMNKWMLQSIQGIKEIKLMRKERYFEKSFAEEGRIYVKSTYTQMTLSSFPKYAIEAMVMSICFVYVALMIYSGTSMLDMVPVVSSIAMAAIRLLPAMSRISGAMAGITFGESAVDKLFVNLKEASLYNDFSLTGASTNPITKDIDGFTEEINICDVEYQYPTGNCNVLDKVEMRIPKGKTIGIVGASGAGKTTVVDVLLGLLKPQKGSVRVDDKDIQTDMEGWLSNIGYIPQAIFMLDASIRENVAFGIEKDAIDDDAVWASLKKAAMDDFVRKLPQGLDTQIGERGMCLSGGQRQRLGIARALYADPALLVFDEATSALDNETEAVVMESINRLQGSKTMVIIAHRLSTIKECDMVYRVENGKIIQDR